MRVVEERAGLERDVLVGVKPTRRDGVLRDIAGSIHAVRHDQTGPMHRRGLRQMVRKVDTHAVTLLELEPRPWHLPIDRIRGDLRAGQDVPADNRRVEIEDLDTALDAGREQHVAFGLNRRRVTHSPRVGRSHIAHRVRRRGRCHDHPGGMTVPRTSSALTRIFTNAAGTNIPAMSRRVAKPVSVASWTRVGAASASWAGPPCSWCS